MALKLAFKKDNKGIVLHLTNVFPNDTLTGRTVKLQIKHQETGTTAEVNHSAIDDTEKTADFNLDTILASAVGTYDAELQLTSGSTLIKDSKTFTFEIDEQVKA